jgi:hypothetical protein
VTAADIAHLMTLQIYLGPEESYPDVARRIIDFTLDGMHTRRGEPRPRSDRRETRTGTNPQSKTT